MCKAVSSATAKSCTRGWRRAGWTSWCSRAYRMCPTRRAGQRGAASASARCGRRAARASKRCGTASSPSSWRGPRGPSSCTFTPSALGLAVPLARLLGLRVVFTHHGRDYMRDKWGRMAKRVLRLGESLAVRYAHRVLAVSDMRSRARVAQAYGREAIYAPNGIAVEARPPAQVEATLTSLGLAPQGYAVAVARLVPEKGVHDLVSAVCRSDDITTLVVVGDAITPSTRRRSRRGHRQRSASSGRSRMRSPWISCAAHGCSPCPPITRAYRSRCWRRWPAVRQWWQEHRSQSRGHRLSGLWLAGRRRPSR